MMCVVCSSGGHLSEALMAISATDVDRYYVTKEDDHVKSRLGNAEVYYVEDPHVSFIGYAVNAYQSVKIYFKKRPDIILTTGAGIALPTCLVGKLLGSKIIFIESGARVSDLSRTGKLLYRVADITYVQWKRLLEKYPKAIYQGRLG